MHVVQTRTALTHTRGTMRCRRRSRRWGHGSLLEGDGDATERHSETVANGAVRGLRGGEVVLRVVAVLLLELEALVCALGVLLGDRCERALTPVPGAELDVVLVEDGAEHLLILMFDCLNSVADFALTKGVLVLDDLANTLHVASLR